MPVRIRKGYKPILRRLPVSRPEFRSSEVRSLKTSRSIESRRPVVAVEVRGVSERRPAVGHHTGPVYLAPIGWAMAVTAAGSPPSGSTRAASRARPPGSPASRLATGPPRWSSSGLHDPQLFRTRLGTEQPGAGARRSGSQAAFSVDRRAHGAPVPSDTDGVGSRVVPPVGTCPWGGQ